MWGVLWGSLGRGMSRIAREAFKLLHCLRQKLLILLQRNPINTDTEGATEIVGINRVHFSVFKYMNGWGFH